MMACSPAPAGELASSSSPSAAASPTLGPSSEGTPIHVTDVMHAWPAVRPRTLDNWHLAGGVAFIEVGITADGNLALGELQVANGGQYIGVGTLNRATAEITTVRKFSNPQTQLVSIAADDNWVVWCEASLQPNFTDWVIYSYDRRTQATRAIAAASKPDGVHFPNTPDVMVWMSHGIVVWSAIVGTDQREHVYAINVDGTGLVTLASDAQGPQFVWPWVMFDTKAANESSDHLMLKNVESGQQAAVSGPSGIAYFAYDGTSVAWIDSSQQNLSIQDVAGGPATSIVLGRPHLQFVQSDSRLVGWGQDDGSYVFDRKLDMTIKLGNLGLRYPIVGATALDWFQSDSSGSQNSPITKQVNVRDLP
jgi:hypothetical protein